MKRVFAKQPKDTLPGAKTPPSRRIDLRDWGSRSLKGNLGLRRGTKERLHAAKPKKTIQDVIEHFLKNPPQAFSGESSNTRAQAYQGNYKDDLSTLKNDSVTVESNMSKSL